MRLNGGFMIGPFGIFQTPLFAPARTVRGEGTEAKKVAERLAGFDAKNCPELKVLHSYFSSGMTHKELNSIAAIVCLLTGLKLDRLASRDNRVLVKWFSENWDTISPVLPKIHLRDENQQVISLEREISELQ